MKKILFLAAMTVACAVANAQMTFGIKGGLNASTFVPNNGNGSARIGVNFGGYANYDLGNSLSVQPELFYNAAGVNAKETDPLTGTTLEGKIKTNYISLPILVKYTFSITKFSLFAGPQIGFLTSAKLTMGSTTEDVKSSFKSTDVAAVFGIGYDINEKINLNLRSQLGLSSIAKDASESVKSNVFGLSLAYKLK